jgi:hypothetical protein
MENEKEDKPTNDMAAAWLFGTFSDHVAKKSRLERQNEKRPMNDFNNKHRKIVSEILNQLKARSSHRAVPLMEAYFEVCKPSGYHLTLAFYEELKKMSTEESTFHRLPQLKDFISTEQFAVVSLQFSREFVQLLKGFGTALESHRRSMTAPVFNKYFKAPIHTFFTFLSVQQLHNFIILSGLKNVLNALCRSGKLYVQATVVGDLVGRVSSRIPVWFHQDVYFSNYMGWSFVTPLENEMANGDGVIFKTNRKSRSVEVTIPHVLGKVMVFSGNTVHTAQGGRPHGLISAAANSFLPASKRRETQRRLLVFNVTPFCELGAADQLFNTECYAKGRYAGLFTMSKAVHVYDNIDTDADLCVRALTNTEVLSAEKLVSNFKQA